jgi:transcriptional regulator GlxA family with amidase domain
MPCCGRPPCPWLEVAITCGFVSASHFSRAYKARFGWPPRAERALETPGA